MTGIYAYNTFLCEDIRWAKDLSFIIKFKDTDSKWQPVSKLCRDEESQTILGGPPVVEDFPPAPAPVIIRQNWIPRADTTVTNNHSYLPSLPIMPAHPVAAVTAVVDPVPLGKLITHSVGMATLGAHQCDEVQRAQVHLEVLLEPVCLWRDARTPGPIAVSIVKVKSEEEERKKWERRQRWRGRAKSSSSTWT